MTRRDLELIAADGYRLGATVHGPESEKEAAAVVVLQGATAVARRFYGRLADDLGASKLPTQRTPHAFREHVWSATP